MKLACCYFFFLAYSVQIYFFFFFDCLGRRVVESKEEKIMYLRLDFIFSLYQCYRKLWLLVRYSSFEHLKVQHPFQTHTP